MEKIDISKVDFNNLKDKKIKAPYHKNVVDMSPDEFEYFVELWLKYCKNFDNKYEVFRIGATGDHGTDVLLSFDKEKIIYQCKHYNKVLGENDVKRIVLKSLWYFMKDFSKIDYPSEIHIVSLNNYSLNILKIYKDMDVNGAKVKLKKAIIDYLKPALDAEDIKYKESDLGEFKNYLETFNYNNIILEDVDVIEKDFVDSKYINLVFETNLPISIPRKIPSNEKLNDEIYLDEIRNLLKQKGLEQNKSDEIVNKSRIEYYSAISLETTCYYLFNDVEEFNKIKNEIETAVKVQADMYYNELYDRMMKIKLEAVHTNTSVSYLDYALHMVTNNDRIGTCHILVNEGNLHWDEK